MDYIVFRRCLAYLGDPAAAEDALQEVFVRALSAKEKFRNQATPRTWLCRIADHLCIDLLRRRRRNPVRPLSLLEAPEGEVPGARAVLQDDRERFRDVYRLMGELDPASRRLAVLYFLDELTQSELARELGLSRRTVGKRLKVGPERA